MAEVGAGNIPALERRVARLESEIGGYAAKVATAVLFGAFCALWAQNTRRSAWLWYFMGAIFTIITVLVLRQELRRSSEDCAHNDAILRPWLPCHRHAGLLHSTPVRFEAVPCAPDAVLAQRERYRAEMRCQLIFYQIHARAGWTEMFSLHADGALAGFGTKAVGGPWRERPTIIEFFVSPEQRSHVFSLFEALLAQTAAGHIETQSNGTMLAHMLHASSREVTTESILFEDKFTTDLPANGATLRQVTPDPEIHAAIECRSGGGDWQLVVDGAVVGQGGILFHYNRPYGDLHMEIAEQFRRQGLGAYFVQELKRACRGLDAIPAARCNPYNLASRHTLQKAGFVPCGHLLAGSITK